MGADVESHRLRNQIIEYAGVVFLLTGASVPFALQGTARLEPTAGNITLIFSFALLFMIGGITTLAALCGDLKCESFLTYFENERRVKRTVARTTAGVISMASVLALLAVLFFSSS